MAIDTRPSNENEGDSNKVLRFFTKSKKRVAASAGATVLSIALIAGACGGESGDGAGHEGGREGAGEHSGGGEGGGEGSGGGERSEGTESGGQAAGPGSATYLTSTGVSRGIKSTQVLAAGDSYAGKLNDLELAIAYDDQNERFVARVKNEAAEPICNTSVKMVADGQTGSQSVLIPALDVADRAEFTIEAPQARFNSWQAETETFTCTSVASHPGEGAEGGGEGRGEHSGGEGSGHDGGGSEGGGESGEETSPSIPVGQPVSGTFNNLDYRVAYDQATNSFMATVTNNTDQTVCASRLEIHMSAKERVIELGPTIRIDLQPGESIDVVLSADPVVPDAYSIHPESSPCP